LHGQLHRSPQIQPNLVGSTCLLYTATLKLPEHGTCCEFLTVLLDSQTRPIGQSALSAQSQAVSRKRLQIQVLGVDFFIHGQQCKRITPLHTPGSAL
jgi:hypothetical protein